VASSTESSPDVDYADKLWQTADKLRGTVDAAEYKHVVLGLLFLKYIFHLLCSVTMASWSKRREFYCNRFTPTDPASVGQRLTATAKTAGIVFLAPHRPRVGGSSAGIHA
jgi:hypothetical protein